MFKKALKFVVYAFALYIIFQIVIVVVFGIEFFWSSRLPNKKKDLENEYATQYNLSADQLQQFKSTKSYFQFLTTDEADSLRHYLDQALKELNDSNSTSSQIPIP
ncbi:MAG TPA: hypothetical protein PLK14_04990 [Sediminibacterium sp.]|nr:hypothetical protein [Sediminibacterium sp.]